MVRITTLKINQTIVHDSNGDTLFSYDTPICTRRPDGSIVLYPDWAYSVTTSKYRAQFLSETTAETRKKLTLGKYEIRQAYAKD